MKLSEIERVAQHAVACLSGHASEGAVFRHTDPRDVVALCAIIRELAEAWREDHIFEESGSGYADSILARHGLEVDDALPHRTSMVLVEQRPVDAPDTRRHDHGDDLRKGGGVMADSHKAAESGTLRDSDKPSPLANKWGDTVAGVELKPEPGCLVDHVSGEWGLLLDDDVYLERLCHDEGTNYPASAALSFTPLLPRVPAGMSAWDVLREMPGKKRVAIDTAYLEIPLERGTIDATVFGQCLPQVAYRTMHYVTRDTYAASQRDMQKMGALLAWLRWNEEHPANPQHLDTSIKETQ